ncbi:hypothetical protein pb186bvf_007071 [Paramecium bursaria]
MFTIKLPFNVHEVLTPIIQSPCRPISVILKSGDYYYSELLKQPKKLPLKDDVLFLNYNTILHSKNGKLVLWDIKNENQLEEYDVKLENSIIESKVINKNRILINLLESKTIQIENSYSNQFILVELELDLDEFKIIENKRVTFQATVRALQFKPINKNVTILANKYQQPHKNLQFIIWNNTLDESIQVKSLKENIRGTLVEVLENDDKALLIFNSNGSGSQFICIYDVHQQNEEIIPIKAEVDYQIKEASNIRNLFLIQCFSLTKQFNILFDIESKSIRYQFNTESNTSLYDQYTYINYFENQLNVEIQVKETLLICHYMFKTLNGHFQESDLNQIYLFRCDYCNISIYPNFYLNQALNKNKRKFQFSLL